MIRHLLFKARSRIGSFAPGARVVLVLGAFILIFFNRLLRGNLILARGDTFLYFYPYWHAAAKALGEGRVPLWNPNLFMGAPFVANSQAGFFYPLNWPLWLLFPTPNAMSISIILHLLIAACGAYLMGRKWLALSRPAAILAALLFSLGGYVSAQVEHINQIQGIAWLPWYFVALSIWHPGKNGRATAAKVCVSVAAILSMQILSGHTQTLFVSLTAIAVWLAASYLHSPDALSRRISGLGNVLREARRLWVFVQPVALGIVLAIGISAVQLVPTLELSRNSIRQGGLPPNEVLSFSMQPLLFGHSLLPAYDDSIYSEYVLFVPITALLLAASGARRAWLAKQARPLIYLAFLGLALALGRFNPVYYLLARAPGFNLFRAPARWSVLYALAIALLAAAGWEALYRLARGKDPDTHRKNDTRALLFAGAAVVCLMLLSALYAPFASIVPVAPETSAETPSLVTFAAWIMELLLATAVLHVVISHGRPRNAVVWIPVLGTVAVLFISTRILAYNHPTTVRAFSEQRAPVSRLLALEECQALGPACPSQPGRLLGLSDIFFDLGDQPELDGIYAQEFGEQELFDYIVASKNKEVLGPNLPLNYGLRSVDGFDGGVLPLESYSIMTGLILPDGRQTRDGRLREHLDNIPEERWLDQFGTRYIITDKVGDRWRQGIFFDMKHPTTVAVGSEPVKVGYLPGYEATDLYLIAAGQPGTISLETVSGDQWLLEPEEVEPDLWRAPFPYAAHLANLALNPCQDEADASVCHDDWYVASLALADARDGTFASILVGEYRLIYSGDVKIYENLDVLPHASLVFDWQFTQDLQDSFAVMATAEFDPEKSAVVLGDGPDPPGKGQGRVLDAVYAAEKSSISIETDQPALLLVREAFYPGWEARIDGAPVDVWSSDILFQGVFVPPGSHVVDLEYRPVSYRTGIVITIASVVGWIFLTVYAVLIPTIRWPRQLAPRDADDSSG